MRWKHLWLAALLAVVTSSFASAQTTGQIIGTVADPQVKAGEGPSRLCLSMEAPDGSRHYRQFRLEPIGSGRRSPFTNW